MPAVGSRHRLRRPRARPRARDESARARRVRRGRDDDREGAGQEPHRALRRRRRSSGPDAPAQARDVRSIAHLKLLQSLSGKLNRLNDVREIGDEIAAELRSLIDYHNCRVSVVDGDDVVPVAFRGDFASETLALPLELLRAKVGTGHHRPLRGDGRVAAHRRRRELRVRDPHPRHADHRGVAPRRAAALRLARRRRHRRLEARPRPVRRGRHAPARGARGPRGRRRRERAALRGRPPRGGERDVTARVRPRARDRRESRRHPAARRRADGRPARLAAHVGLAAERPAASSRRASCTATRRRSARASSRAASTPSARRAASSGRSRSCSAPIEWSRIEGDPLEADASYAIAPIEIDGRVGCIVAALPAGEFGERELRLLGGLAHQAKLAIASASNYEGLEQTFVSTVEALANALEANDEYTSRHARWITDLSLRVGRELGLDDAR